MFKNKKIIVVMPAYNAGRTLRRTHADVREQDLVDTIILVDDRSRDDTVAVAQTPKRSPQPLGSFYLMNL
mgnify:CR=1 FL=1